MKTQDARLDRGKVERKYVPVSSHQRLRDSRDRLLAEMERMRVREKRLRHLVGAVDAVIRDPGNDTWRSLMAARKKAKAVLGMKSEGKEGAAG